MSRARLQAIAAETLSILKAGGYRAVDGRFVDLSEDLRRSIGETEDVTAPPDMVPMPGLPRLSLADEDTLGGIATVMSETHGVPAVLNFASARNPGGGFERGANAQEEALCRDTTLYAGLRGQSAFYARNKASADGVYTDALLYTPGVRVIRDPHGMLVPEPTEIAVLTVPAPNQRALKEQGAWPARRAALEAAFEARISMMLRVAQARGHRALVLGAWGCGVFGNDPYDVAARFAAGLQAFGGAFEHVHFAIPAGGKEGNLAAFRAVLGGGGG